MSIVNFMFPIPLSQVIFLIDQLRYKNIILKYLLLILVKGIIWLFDIRLGSVRLRLFVGIVDMTQFLEESQRLTRSDQIYG